MATAARSQASPSFPQELAGRPDPTRGPSGPFLGPRSRFIRNQQDAGKEVVEESLPTGIGSSATNTFYLDLVVKFTCKTRVFRLKSQRWCSQSPRLVERATEMMSVKRDKKASVVPRSSRSPAPCLRGAPFLSCACTHKPPP